MVSQNVSINTFSTWLDLLLSKLTFLSTYGLLAHNMSSISSIDFLLLSSNSKALMNYFTKNPIHYTLKGFWLLVLCLFPPCSQNQIRYNTSHLKKKIIFSFKHVTTYLNFCVVSQVYQKVNTYHEFNCQVIQQLELIL